MPRVPSNGPGSFSIVVIRILRGVLRQRNARQRDLAAHAAISESQVSRILSYQKEITLDQFEGFCLALDISMEDVIYLAQDERVWGNLSALKIEGVEIDKSPLTDAELYEIRRSEGDRTRLVIEDSSPNSSINTSPNFIQPNWEDLPRAADGSPDEPGEGDEGYHDGP